MDKDVLAGLLEEGLSLEAIGERVGKHPSTVGYWVKKHGLTAANAERHRNTGGIDREQLEELVARHLSIRQIAAELECSTATVRHWLAKYGLRTTPSQRRTDRGEATHLERFVSECRHHGEAVFVVRTDGSSTCVRCRSEAVAERRRKIKAILVAEAGGKCAICGYDRLLNALQFHHLDPATKKFNLGLGGVTRSLARSREEARKCVLLCATCHVEVEAGVAAVPANICDAAAEHPG